jgi:diacylglycerol kinase (ATP)
LNRILIIANPFSGTPQGRFGPESIAREIRAAGHEVTIAWTEGPRHAADLAAGGAGTHDLVVAQGGDGTVHEVASGLVGTGCPMAVIAAGSGNDFARGIGCHRPEQGLAAILTGRDAAVDACELDGRTFVNSLGLLASGLVSNRAATMWRWLGGNRYALAALRTIVDYHGQDVTWTIPGQGEDSVLAGRYFFTEICNGPFTGGGFRFGPDASLADGLMDVCLIEPVGPVTGLRLLPRATRGERVEHPKITQLRCAELVFESPAPVAYHLDGEASWLEPGRHSVRVQDRKLTVRVPRDWTPDA